MPIQFDKLSDLLLSGQLFHCLKKENEKREIHISTRTQGSHSRESPIAYRSVDTARQIQPLCAVESMHSLKKRKKEKRRHFNKSVNQALLRADQISNNVKGDI